ncbi:MAG: repressor LexA [Bdellovibrionaceae bacterium]|nr:repressor LexA [Pseudobdellovibrionaceae bacterium]
MKTTLLTEQEQKTLKAVKKFLETNRVPPTYRELQNLLGYESIGSVQKLIKQLVAKSHLHISGEKRGISVIGDHPSAAYRIPLLGKIAAGRPIEAIENKEFLDVPKEFFRIGQQAFALQIQGDSMIDDHILDQDIVILKKQKTADSGDTVAAIINNNATLKRFYKKKNTVELHSANPKYKPIIVDESADFEILGVLTGVIRRV